MEAGLDEAERAAATNVHPLCKIENGDSCVVMKKSRTPRSVDHDLGGVAVGNVEVPIAPVGSIECRLDLHRAAG